MSIWKQKDGVNISTNLMDRRHLYNTLNMIINNCKDNREALQFLLDAFITARQELIDAHNNTFLLQGEQALCEFETGEDDEFSPEDANEFDIW